MSEREFDWSEVREALGRIDERLTSLTRQVDQVASDVRSLGKRIDLILLGLIAGLIGVIGTFITVILKSG
jgi:tetrahydromethanopterin S-methyltransferase subunit G